MALNTQDIVLVFDQCLTGLVWLTKLSQQAQRTAL